MYLSTFQKLPSKYAAAKNYYNAGEIETSFQTKHTVELGPGLKSYSKGRRTRQGRGHSRDGRPQGRIVSSRSNSRKRSNASNGRKIEKLLRWKGKTYRRGHVRGRRSIRSRQKPAAKVDVISGESYTPKDITEETSIFVQEDINEGKMEANPLNASIWERSDYEDDVYQATGDAYDYQVDHKNGYQGGFSEKSENFIEQSHYNVDCG